MPSRSDVVLEQLSELKTDLGALWVALTKDPKKEARKERTWSVLAGIAGTVAAVGAGRVATRAWGVLTGEAPPAPGQQQPPRQTAA